MACTEKLLTWANAQPDYRVTPLYDSAGKAGRHFLDDLEEHGLDFKTLMQQDAVFAQIIDMDLEAEQIADASFAPLGEMAPNDKVKRIFIEWLGFMNVDLQPWTTGGAIHFRPHWARTLLLALYIGEEHDLSETDLRCLAMAAVFHDSRRMNPYLDTGHGERAARYYCEFCKERPCAHTTTVGKFIRLDPRCYLAIRWHDRDDELGLQEIERAIETNRIDDLGIDDLQAWLPQGAKASAALIYRIFKDADGLDRVRLGKGEPDVSFLRTQTAHELLPFAYRLLDASANCHA